MRRKINIILYFKICADIILYFKLLFHVCCFVMKRTFGHRIKVDGIIFCKRFVFAFFKCQYKSEKSEILISGNLP